MFEKRKNSDKQSGLSLGLALLLLLGGLYAGMNIGTGISEDETSVTVNQSLEVIDVSGEWVGTATEDYGNESRYDYRVVIEQNGSTIVGMSYLDMASGAEIYSESPIAGYIEGNTVFYTETDTTVLENISLDNWCLSDNTLSYEVLDGQEVLVGTWDLADHEREECGGITGRVILTRQAD